MYALRILDARVKIGGLGWVQSWLKNLAHWTMSESAFTNDFGGLVRYVYSVRTTAGCQLQRLMAEFAACMTEDVCGSGRLDGVVERGA